MARKLSHEEITENRATLDTLSTIKKLPVRVVCDSIRSSYNIGSLFRTSDGAQIEKLYLAGYTPAPPKKEILKTALGSTESVEWEKVEDVKELLQNLKAEGYKICALELTEKSIPHYNLTVEHFPLCLILGNEITGVNQEYLDLCDFTVEIPQYGIKQSLNVSVAYGISIYEMRRVFDLNVK